MQTRHPGNSDLEVTPIGIGAWAMGVATGLSPGDARKPMNRLQRCTRRDAVFVYDARFALQHPPRFTKTCRWPVILASRKAILIKLKLSARPVAARSAGQNEQWNGWIKKLVGVADDWQLC